jgi:hypothetical protein
MTDQAKNYVLSRDFHAALTANRVPPHDHPPIPVADQREGRGVPSAAIQ